MPRIATIGSAFCLACGLALPAAAADDWTVTDDGTDLSIRLGAGGMLTPDYEGSDDYELQPFPIVDLEFLRIPGIGSFGGDAGRTGLRIGPSFRFVGGRDQDDNAALRGLGDVDMAFEAGVKAEYLWPHASVYAAIRQGFGGHQGVVADFGVNAIVRPTDRLTVTAGPRLRVASDDVFDTYFGVTPAQAAASGLAAYDPGAGIESAGVAGEAVYALTGAWSAHLRASWDVLVGDAADSPIVAAAGDENQVTIGLGLSYRFDLDLFD